MHEAPAAPRVASPRAASPGGTPRGAPRDGRPSAGLAVLLSGIAPGAGHLHAGRPLRGLVLVVLLVASSLPWVSAVGVSWHAATLLLAPPLAASVALLVDAAVSARRSAQSWLPARPWIRRLACVGIAVLTAGLVPAGLAGATSHVALIARQPDDLMAPAVREADRVVVDRVWWRSGDLDRGDLVLVPADNLAAPPFLRRVIGLPGESIAVRRGRIHVNGQRWAADPARPPGGPGALEARATVAAGEILVLSDVRKPHEDRIWRCPLAAIQGRASYVLLPAAADPYRVGQALR